MRRSRVGKEQMLVKEEKEEFTGKIKAQWVNITEGPVYGRKVWVHGSKVKKGRSSQLLLVA